jgi:hypothetical protein
VPVIALAEQIGLPELVTEHVAITGAANGAGANPVAKVMSLVAGMVAGIVAGADSIEDMDRLRHTGNVVFEQILPPRRWHVFARVDPRACATAQRGAATQPHDTVATADTDDSANALVGHRRRHSGWGIRPPEAGAQVRILPGALRGTKVCFIRTTASQRPAWLGSQAPASTTVRSVSPTPGG